MPENAEERVFRGFKGPRYTQTPNEIFDDLLEPGYLTEAELRVLLYIVRRTFGWAKDSDAISLTQLTDGIMRQDGVRMDWGAGVKRPAASRAVQGLERKGIIVADRVRTVERGDQSTIYRLRMADEEPQSPKETPPVLLRNPGGFSEETPPVSLRNSGGFSDDTGGGSPKSLGLVSQRNPQKNVQKTIKQKTTQVTIDFRAEEPDEEQAGTDEEEGLPPYSAWIAAVITDYSREFNDLANTTINVSKALRLWRSSGIGEEAFVRVLQQAKEATRKAQGSRGGVANKMARLLQIASETLAPGGRQVG